MTPEDFLKNLNQHSEVFELSVEYEYTEKQLLLFAKLYHENELKKFWLGAVSGQSEQLKCPHCNQLEPCAGNSPETCYHPKVC